MSNEFDDLKEFVQDAENYENEAKKFSTKGLLTKMYAQALAVGETPTPVSEDEEEKKKKESTRGYTQYQLYGPGYKVCGDTIKLLPSGCYDVLADNTGPFAVPMPKPTGLLLELPEMRSEEVINIVNTFWDSEKDYKDGNEFVVGGAAFKAGIMLYGPPGTGKSCTIKIVANKLVERGGTVFFSSMNPYTTMQFLSQFYEVEDSRKSIVILEDIDSMIERFGEAGFLEMLDSAKTIDNVMFIATTNYPDRLDPRIYNRPGRFSHVVKIGLPTANAREAYLKAILKNYRDVPYIVEHTNNFSIDHLASLVNAVYREKKDLQKEIERLKILFRVPKIEEKTMGIGM